MGNEKINYKTSQKSWNFEGKKVSTFENVATIFDRICQNLSQAWSQYINVLSTQTSAKEDIIFGMKNQISIAPCLNLFSFPNFKASDFGWEVDDECRDRFRTSDPSGVIW